MESAQADLQLCILITSLSIAGEVQIAPRDADYHRSTPFSRKAHLTVRVARVVCTDGDSDEDFRCGILRPEHRNVFPISALSTTSDRTA